MNICDITDLTSEVHGDICMFVSLYLEEGGRGGNHSHILGGNVLHWTQPSGFKKIVLRVYGPNHILTTIRFEADCIRPRVKQTSLFGSFLNRHSPNIYESRCIHSRFFVSFVNMSIARKK